MAPTTSSRGCDEAVRHRFDNDSQTTVDCFWLDYEGKEVRYGTVHPGLSHLQSAYYCTVTRGLVLVLEEESNSCVESIRVRVCMQSFATH